MRTVHKARIVPDSVPEGLAERVIKVSDLGVPIAAALGRWEALTKAELWDVLVAAQNEIERRHV